MSDFIKLPNGEANNYLNTDFIIYVSHSSYSIRIYTGDDFHAFTTYELDDTNDAKKDYYFVLEQLKEKGIIS